MVKKVLKKSHDDMPATIRLVKEVRKELLSEIRSLEHKMDSRFCDMESRFSGMDSKFSGLESRFSGLESRFDKLEAVAHRTNVLMEEQRSENRIVLDGLKVVIERQERLEKEHQETRRIVNSLAQIKPQENKI